MKFYKNVKEFLNFFLLLLSIFTVFNILILCIIKIDESKLSETRFCPNCGIDLVEGR